MEDPYFTRLFMGEKFVIKSTLEFLPGTEEIDMHRNLMHLYGLCPALTSPTQAVYSFRYYKKIL